MFRTSVDSGGSREQRWQHCFPCISWRQLAALAVAFLILFLVILSPGTALGQERGQIFESVPEAGPRPQHQYALLIANEKYTFLSDLTTPSADVDALATLLKNKYHFSKVTVLPDADRGEMTDALDELLEQVTEQDDLLIYYAGHGHFDKKTQKGYWQGVEAKQTRRSDWLSNDIIKDTLKASRAAHVLVISDSCFSGTLVRSDLGMGLRVAREETLLQELASRRSRTALTSGGLEPVDDGGGEGHSAFASSLIRVLNSNERPIARAEQIFSEMPETVTLNSATRQVIRYDPIAETRHEGGDFLFYQDNSSSGHPLPLGQTIEYDTYRLAAQTHYYDPWSGAESEKAKKYWTKWTKLDLKDGETLLKSWEGNDCEGVFLPLIEGSPNYIYVKCDCCEMPREGPGAVKSSHELYELKPLRQVLAGSQMDFIDIDRDGNLEIEIEIRQPFKELMPPIDPARVNTWSEEAYLESIWQPFALVVFRHSPTIGTYEPIRQSSDFKTLSLLFDHLAIHFHGSSNISLERIRQFSAKEIKTYDDEFKYLSEFLSIVLTYIYNGRKQAGWEIFERDYKLANQKDFLRDRLKEVLASEVFYQKIAETPTSQ